MGTGAKTYAFSTPYKNLPLKAPDPEGEVKDLEAWNKVHWGE